MKKTAVEEYPHTFHIPVMGTGFTVDTPLRVAKYGISSAISLVDDTLIEQMRKFYCEKEEEPYEAITASHEDARARRITAYLDLLERLIRRQVQALQAAPFEAGSEITRYYELLPDSPLREAYTNMLAADDPAEKTQMQDRLRRHAVPGSVDVNIMTKMDHIAYNGSERMPPEFSDAMSALRGFANSTLRSSVVFSAGMNPRLYGYTAQFDDFFPDEEGVFKKKITMKVSDYRSAEVQARFLAKRGLWVSEYRIESGLNCGGHAFATDGHLLGPILEEFKKNRQGLIETVHAVYAKTLAARGLDAGKVPVEARITVQGGIGTALEDKSLLEYYEVDATGWATPFLLVPEVSNVDNASLQKLLNAVDGDIYLSGGSPLHIPYWNLRTCDSEETRRRWIEEGKPGSPCPKKHAAFDTEFTDIPICAASRGYVKRRLQKLAEEDLSEERRMRIKEGILSTSCICHDLAGGTVLKHGIDPNAHPAVCPGPNILNFSKVATLEEMVGHIYGRLSLLVDSERPHMFIKEIMLYLDYLRKEAEMVSLGLLERTQKYFSKFRENLLAGMDYYLHETEKFVSEHYQRFQKELDVLRKELISMPLPCAVSPAK